jgi:RNA polymerase sigma factor (sigma-70 family)
LARARAGDGGAFAALVQPYVADAIRLAYVITGSTSLAEEATQEGLMRAYNALSRFDQDRPFRPWLLRIVANASKNARRSAVRRETVHTRASSLAPTTASGVAEDLALAGVERDAVVAALAKLDERDREVVVYRYFAGLSEQETAAAIGCPPGTVKSRHARAIRQLRQLLVAESDDA